VIGVPLAVESVTLLPTGVLSVPPVTVSVPPVATVLMALTLAVAGSVVLIGAQQRWTENPLVGRTSIGVRLVGVGASDLGHHLDGAEPARRGWLRPTRRQAGDG
jgi:hypothetical protein